MRRSDPSPSIQSHNISNNYIGEFEELVLLAILSLRNDAYGVKIADAIEKATGRSVSIGALYTTLSRLEEKGLVRSRLGEATAARGGRAKRFYKIEAPAQTALRHAEAGRRRLIASLSGVGATT